LLASSVVLAIDLLFLRKSIKRDALLSMTISFRLKFWTSARISTSSENPVAGLTGGALICYPDAKIGGGICG